MDCVTCGLPYDVDTYTGLCQGCMQEIQVVDCTSCNAKAEEVQGHVDELYYCNMCQSYFS